MARLAKCAGRYEGMSLSCIRKCSAYDSVEMTESVNSIVSLASGRELTVEERTLLNVAYRNAIGVRRDSLRIIHLYEERETYEPRLQLLKPLRNKLESEVDKFCEDILRIFVRMIPLASRESKGYYHKWYVVRYISVAMIDIKQRSGDFHRYIAESTYGERRDDNVKKSMMSYEAAKEIIHADLPPTDAFRLSLALDYSLLYHDVLHDIDTSFSITKQAFDGAAVGLLASSLSAESYRSSTEMMQMLGSNLGIWVNLLHGDVSPSRTQSYSTSESQSESDEGAA